MTWRNFEWTFAWMSITQASFGLVFLCLAVAGLRPLRGSSWPGANPQTGWWTRLAAAYRRFVDARSAAALTRNELLATRANRPPCGDDPMLWKERFTRMGGGLRWMSSRPVALFFIVLLGCYLFDVTVPVFADLVKGRWHDRTFTQMNSAASGRECDSGGSGDLADQRRRRLEHHFRARAGYLDQPGDKPAHTTGDHRASSSARSGAHAGSESGSSGSWAPGLSWGRFIRSGWSSAWLCSSAQHGLPQRSAFLPRRSRATRPARSF